MMPALERIPIRRRDGDARPARLTEARADHVFRPRRRGSDGLHVYDPPLVSVDPRVTERGNSLPFATEHQMPELIEHDDSNKDELVRIADSDHRVSLKVYQDISHQVTGRTGKKSGKSYRDNLLIDFGEIDQLNLKITQLCDVHRIAAANVVITVFHEKDRKEQFTSFERFRAYNANASSPTLSILLKYVNFSIIPSGIARPQEYTVSIRLVSRLASANQLGGSPSEVMFSGFFSVLSDQPWRKSMLNTRTML